MQKILSCMWRIKNLLRTRMLQDHFTNLDILQNIDEEIFVNLINNDDVVEVFCNKVRTFVLYCYRLGGTYAGTSKLCILLDDVPTFVINSFGHWNLTIWVRVKRSFEFPSIYYHYGAEIMWGLNVVDCGCNHCLR